jgi:class 3 adenylate cyclase
LARTANESKTIVIDVSSRLADHSPMVLPTGTVTFLFTDIEGSTQRWDEFPDAMSAALERHDALMCDAVETNEGQVFKTVGDAFCAAFKTAGAGTRGARS